MFAAINDIRITADKTPQTIVSERKKSVLGRSGYSLIEVMIAVTLTLVLMYAIAAIFGRVSSIMSRTQNILSMTNNLRAAKDRLITDLENLTVPQLKAPTSKYGFFSYSEGLGNGFNHLNFAGSERFCEPLNSRTGSTYGNFDNSRNVQEDTNVGDTDDILSFTVRAPAGKWFRGRCFKKDPDYLAEIDENIEMIESEYAEVIWFLRGTTLYRRVLLIVPDDVLQERLGALDRYLYLAIDSKTNQKKFPAFQNLSVLPTFPSLGYGFHRFFDVSVHFDENKEFVCVLDDSAGMLTHAGSITANTLADLSNRENRYGYWHSPLLPAGSYSTPICDNWLHGDYSAWYWLRMPTMQESALWTGGADPLQYFRAGFSFGRSDQDGDISMGWVGPHLLLEGVAPNKRTFASNDLPQGYFIDDWRMPNPWIQQEAFSGQLNLINWAGISGDNFDNNPELNNDVLLTNVLSFDVKVWNPNNSKFVDLGADEVYARDDNGNLILDNDGKPILTGISTTDPSDFRSKGNYSAYVVGNQLKPLKVLHSNQCCTTFYRPCMPAVFDTWTSDYQKDFLTETWPIDSSDGSTIPPIGSSSRPDFTIADIPLDENVTASDLPDYPPPYESEIKVIHVELRTFDPTSRTIKNATVEVKIP